MANDELVPMSLWEEVRRNQGSRLTILEQRVTRIEDLSLSRYERISERLEELEQQTQHRFDARDKETNADKRLIFVSLIAPFIILIGGMIISEVFIH